MSSDWASFHTHSVFSALDSLASVEDLVAKAARDGQGGMALTDHGNLAGTVRLYKAAKAHGILPFPGVEAYLIDPQYDLGSLDSKELATARRFHVVLFALDTKGYEELVRFVSLSHTRPRFNRFPRVLFDDLVQLASRARGHVAILSGCFFGLAQQRLVDEGQVGLTNTLRAYRDLFGDWAFVELQNHKIDHGQGRTDADIIEDLRRTAQHLGMPTIITQDSHYTEFTDKKAHALMKRMVYGSEDDAFPGTSYHLPSQEWVRDQHTEQDWQASAESVRRLLDANRVSIPALDTFQANIPSLSGAPDQKLRRKVASSLRAHRKSLGIRRSTVQGRRYKERADYELDIIGRLGMAPFFLIMDDTVQHCREQGYAIEARGSANGSLVCFLLGITQVDPLVWDTDFDRFMSLDRIKPPDIDMDIEDIRQDAVFAYLEGKYDTSRIGTWMRLGYREEDQRGGVVVTYATYLRRKLAEEVGKQHAGPEFAKRYGKVDDLEDVKRINRKDARALTVLAGHNAFKSYGVHPGGILISSSEHRLHELVPTMLVPSSDKIVTQYDMDDVEDMGYLKADWLGQSSLRVMRRCQELMGRKDATDFTWIPYEDKDALKELRSGRTDTGVFHFEAPAKAKGGREMAVRNVRDVIHCSALYMPGAADTGAKDHYLRMRNSPDQRARQKYLHPIFEEHLKPTHGAVVFQDQVLQIFKSLGISVASFNTLLKAMKDSGSGAASRNTERMDKVRAEFYQACADHGVPADEAWDMVSGVVVYAFNKSHAVGYGIRSYRTAYLKVHYPLEYMSALLEVWAGTKKEAAYVREARRMGVRIYPPHINLSGESWTMDKSRNSLRRGLTSVPGIGKAVAHGVIENRGDGYKSVADFIRRVPARVASGGKLFLDKGTYSGNIAKFESVGAFADLPLGRDDEDEED